MFKHNQKAQQDVCLICFEPLLKDGSFVHIVSSLPICLSCMQKFHCVHEESSLLGYPMLTLYLYDEFFKGLLFQYKGLYDYALKDVFLCLYKEELLYRYKKNTIFVVAPSSEEDNQIRGFKPMYSIVQTLSEQVFDGLYKKESYKQSSLSYVERLKVKDKIGLKDGDKLKGKDVVIVDDVMTSGSTLKACIELVEEVQPQSIQVLVLSKK